MKSFGPLLLLWSVARGQQQCSVCPEGSTMQDPDRLFVSIEGLDTPTCQELQIAMDEEQIEDCQSILDAVPFDLASFCGCTNQTAPTMCDGLCVEGYYLFNPDALVAAPPPLVGEVRCGELDMLANYIDDGMACGLFRYLTTVTCCEYETYPPTPAPTSSPTMDTSSASRSPMSGLVGVMLFGLLYNI